jgi:choice-of-anchor C domain-containing protein
MTKLKKSCHKIVLGYFLSMLTFPVCQVALSIEATSPLGPNLVTNGDFETVPNYTEGKDFHIVEHDQPDLSGWSVYRGTVNVFQGKWHPVSGTRCLDLNGSDCGAICQTIPTEAGAQYQLDFYLAGNLEGAPAQKSIYVRAANQHSIYSFNCAGRTHQSLGWERITWTFTATGSASTVEIGSLTNGTHAGALIDLVAVRKMIEHSPAKVHSLA